MILFLSHIDALKRNKCDTTPNRVTCINTHFRM